MVSAVFLTWYRNASTMENIQRVSQRNVLMITDIDSYSLNHDRNAENGGQTFTMRMT